MSHSPDDIFQDYLRLQDSMSAYLQDIFLAIIQGEKAWRAALRLKPGGAPQWSDEVQTDLVRAAKILASAWTHSGKSSANVFLRCSCVLVSVSWRADDLRSRLSKMPSGMDPLIEDKLLTEFPPICSIDEIRANELLLLQRPAILLDRDENVLAWFLPGMFDIRRQVSISVQMLIFIDSTSSQGVMLYATESIRPNLHTKGTPAVPGEEAKQWRTSPTFYRPGHEWPCGAWLASPGGYAVGHKVSLFCLACARSH